MNEFPALKWCIVGLRMIWEEHIENDLAAASWHVQPHGSRGIPVECQGPTPRSFWPNGRRRRGVLGSLGTFPC